MSFRFLALALPLSLFLQEASLNGMELDREAQRFHDLSKEPASCSFTPPQGWSFEKTNELPPEIKALVKGQGKHELAPSLNLSAEETDLDLNSYLRVIKSIHEASPDTEWRRLGTLQTTAGPATLTQIDSKTAWGDIRMMQSIIVRNKMAYIVTATALQEEFPHFYKEFFQAIQSITIKQKDFADVSNPQKREILKREYESLKRAWSKTFHEMAGEEQNQIFSSYALAEVSFEDENFQERHWEPFQAFLREEFNDLGAEWRNDLLEKTRENLLWVR